jgi:hypothetical protein
MKASHRVLASAVTVLTLLLVGAAGLAAQEGHPLCGLWVNTAYNGSPEPAVLVWTEDGTLTAYDESFDTRAAGCCCCTVSDHWSEGGSTWFTVISVASFMGGVELRATSSVYRLSADGTTLERLGVSALPVDRTAAQRIQVAARALYYRQRPNGLTPAPASAGPTG